MGAGYKRIRLNGWGIHLHSVGVSRKNQLAERQLHSASDSTVNLLAELHGGMPVVGGKTRDLTTQLFSELLELWISGVWRDFTKFLISLGFPIDFGGGKGCGCVGDQGQLQGEF